MICTECDNDVFEANDDGCYYCLNCNAKADGIIATGVADEDFVGANGGTQGATYRVNDTRRRPSQLITPQKPHLEESTRYSQFRSGLISASQIQQYSVNEKRNLFRNVKTEPDNFDDVLPTEPADFVAETLSYNDYYEEARDRYVKGLLLMITYQCDALVEKFKVTPLIIGLVGPICLRFVALSGVYDDNWADNTIHDSEFKAEGQVREVKRNRNKTDDKMNPDSELKSEEGEEASEDKRRDRHKGEPRNFDGKRAVTIWISQLRKSLPLSNSLAISFLACHKAGASVLPTDIVRWAQEGKIPYLSCFLKIREQMGETSAACPVGASIMFRPFQVVSAQILEARAALIADMIGLPLPPVNFYGIASKYLNRLSIPEDKVLDVVLLIQNWSMPPDLYLSKNEHRLPTRVCVMSILIVAIRMIYNINGFGMWERSLSLVNTNEEDYVPEEFDSPVHDEEEVSETKSADAESSDATKATEFETEELLKNLEAKFYEVAGETVEYEKDLLSYLLHGKNEIFAGLADDSPDDTYRTVNNLWNGYPKDEELRRFGTQSKRRRDWEDVLSLNQLSLDEINNPCSSPSRRSESGSMDHDLASSEHVVSSPKNHNHHQEEKSKERTMKRLITDMGENLFCYIPPRVKVKRLDYLHYVRKRDDGALIYAAHADYYILLRVCARIAEIDVRNMHRGVLIFEKRLAWIEKRIDHVLNLTPPFMTCDHCCDGGNVDEDQDDDMILSQDENLIL